MPTRERFEETHVTPFMVIERTSSGDSHGWGTQTFTVPPRTGEYVTRNDENGIGQAYRVLAVIHPLRPAETAGDLIVQHVGTALEMLQKL